jgi:hypothetical protein
MSSYLSGSSGGLINTGFTCFIPAAGSLDAQLLTLQTNAAAACEQFISGYVLVRNGKDISREVQLFYFRLAQSVPMTLAAAQGYVGSGVTAGFWTSGVIDWQAGLALVKSTAYPA